MKNPAVFVTIGIGIIILSLWNPFGSIEDITKVIPRPPSREKLISLLKETEYPSPEKLILDNFKNHDIIFLGEMTNIKENQEFFISLIPKLYKAGITNAGIRYLLYENQDRLDALITGSYYDESITHELLFNYDTRWGFKEYESIVREIWEFNNSLPPGSQPFRLVGLSPKNQWGYIRSLSDTSDPKVLRQVFSNGFPEEYMAAKVEKEFIAKGEKALIFSHMDSAFTNFKNKEYADKQRAYHFPDKTMGQIIKEKLGEKTMTICIHGPFPNNRSFTGLYYPVNAVIDNLWDALPENRRPFAFSTQTNAGYLPITETTYTKGYTTLMLKDFCDAYIVLTTLAELHAVTPIRDFINKSNYALALKNSANPSGEEVKILDMNRFIYDYSEQLQKILDMFE